MSNSTSRRGVVRIVALVSALVGMRCGLAGEILRVPSQYATIQAAVDAAAPGDTVLVADGTYRGPGNRDIDLAGKAITVRSEHGPGTCVIDCEGTSPEPHRGFRVANYESSATRIEGFMIEFGLAPAEPNCPSSGGGLFIYSANPTIRNCVFVQNTTQSWG